MMPSEFRWKGLFLWIVIALVLVALFNMVQQPGEKPMGQPHDMTQIFINWFPMLLLIGVWMFFLIKMRGGKLNYLSPEQREQTEAMKAAAKALERIATALEARRL